MKPKHYYIREEMICDHCNTSTTSILPTGRADWYHWNGLCVCKRCYHHLYFKQWRIGRPHYFKQYNRQYAKDHPDYVKEYKRDRRMELMTSLCNGEPKCMSCGEIEIIRLHIDHINGDGWYDRTIRFADTRGNESRRRFFTYYNRHIGEAREKLQVLCYSCHFVKSIANGDCNGYKKQRLEDRNQTKISIF